MRGLQLPVGSKGENTWPILYSQGPGLRLKWGVDSVPSGSEGMRKRTFHTRIQPELSDKELEGKKEWGSVWSTHVLPKQPVITAPPDRGACAELWQGSNSSTLACAYYPFPLLQGQLNEDKLKGKLRSLENQLYTCTQVSFPEDTFGSWIPNQMKMLKL